MIQLISQNEQFIFSYVFCKNIKFMIISSKILSFLMYMCVMCMHVYMCVPMNVGTLICVSVCALCGGLRLTPGVFSDAPPLYTSLQGLIWLRSLLLAFHVSVSSMQEIQTMPPCSLVIYKCAREFQSLCLPFKCLNHHFPTSYRYNL